MRFGVNLPNFGPGTTPEVLREWAVVSEQLGYHLLLVSDHVALTDDANARSPAPFFESFTTLAWLAGQTSNLQLGTGVVITTHRHPLLLARITATLDQLSGSRLIVGVGVGWAAMGFEALGLPFHHRGRLTDEYLAALRQLWASSSATFHGATIQFDDIHTDPRPVQEPGPPIWIGGNSPGAIRRAARLGDAWHPLWPRLAPLTRVLPILRSLGDAAGRPHPAFCPRIALDIRDRPLPEQVRFPGQGTLEQIREDFQVLEFLGADYVVVDTDPGNQRLRRPPEQDWQMLRILTEKVIDPAHERLR